MKLIKFFAFIFIGLGVLSCAEDNDDATPFVPTNVTTPMTSVDFKLSNDFDGTLVDNTNFTTLTLTNENGEVLRAERIRYLISKLELTSVETGTVYKLKDYNLLDISDETTYNFTSDIQIPLGTYKLSMVWGFNEEDNVDGVYVDLNAASWGWPQGLGGGYHFLQFDGKYNVDTASPMPFNFHNGTAKNAAGEFEQNFVTFAFDTDILIAGNTEIELKMNIAELFRNPNTWDLNVLDTPLMPNYTAQKMMQQNVASVFSIGTISNN